MRPLIGITCSSLTLREHGPRIFRLNQVYARAIEQAGGAPMLIPSLGENDALRAVYDTLDGIMLPGGADIDPVRYLAMPLPQSDEPDTALDESELALARWALSEDKAVLGVCRGQQCLNVAAGGTLFQDLPIDVPYALAHRVEPRNEPAHDIAIEADSRLADLLGVVATKVNSLHHQAVRDVAPGFVAVAWAPDGIVEGIECPGHRFAVAVQFHPEELVPGHEPSERLFSRFVNEAAQRHKRPSYGIS